MRGSDPDAAVYYLAAMLEGGEDARFIARRMIVLASEDIGNADPQALVVAVAAAQAVEHVGLPEARLNLAQAAIYLALAPKSNASYVAINEATADVREHGTVEAAEVAARRELVRTAARSRQGLRLSARRPERIRGRLPPGRAQGQEVLQAGLMRLHVYEWGDPDAPPVVCLHGVTAHGERFMQLAEERWAEHFHVIAPDLRGHGRSGWDAAVGLRHARRRSDRDDRRSRPRAAGLGRPLVRRSPHPRACRAPSGTDPACRAARPGDRHPPATWPSSWPTSSGGAGATTRRSRVCREPSRCRRDRRRPRARGHPALPRRPPGRPPPAADVAGRRDLDLPRARDSLACSRTR